MFGRKTKGFPFVFLFLLLLPFPSLLFSPQQRRQKTWGFFVLVVLVLWCCWCRWWWGWCYLTNISFPILKVKKQKQFIFLLSSNLLLLFFCMMNKRKNITLGDGIRFLFSFFFYLYIIILHSLLLFLVSRAPTNCASSLPFVNPISTSLFLPT